MKRDNYDAHMALLDTALILKKVADVILSDERCDLKALEDISKRMASRMSSILSMRLEISSRAAMGFGNTEAVPVPRLNL
jgi:hypothetical protein